MFDLNIVTCIALTLVLIVVTVTAANFMIRKILKIDPNSAEE